MRYRKPVNKSRSAAQFRKNVKQTKQVNIGPPPMRGGYRF